MDSGRPASHKETTAKSELGSFALPDTETSYGSSSSGSSSYRTSTAAPTQSSYSKKSSTKDVDGELDDLMAMLNTTSAPRKSTSLHSKSRSSASLVGLQDNPPAPKPYSKPKTQPKTHNFEPDPLDDLLDTLAKPSRDTPKPKPNSNYSAKTKPAAGNGEYDPLEDLLSNFSTEMNDVEAGDVHDTRGICYVCKKPIRMNEKIVKAMGKAYHQECFCCVRCKIKNVGFYESKGQLFCEPCYKKECCQKCAGCGEALVSGKALKALKATWHRECFVCQGPCRKSMAGVPFYPINNKPCCQDCYPTVAARQ